MTSSFKRYRATDLGIYAFLVVVFELIAVFARNSWFKGSVLSLSVVPALVAIVMMRWGGYAVIHSVLGGLVYCIGMYFIVGGLTAAQFFSQVIGNAFVALSLAFLLPIGYERVRKNVWLSVLFPIVVYLSMQIGRSLVAMMFGESFSIAINFIALYSASLILAEVAVLITRKLDGVFENQLVYLTRTEAARKEAIEEDHLQYQKKKSENGDSDFSDDK